MSNTRDGNACFIAGWGYPASIFEDLLRDGDTALSLLDLLSMSNASNLAIDGRISGYNNLPELSPWARGLSSFCQEKQPSTIVAWSMAAMVTFETFCHVCSREECVIELPKLILISGTPSFVKRKNWTYGHNERTVRAMQCRILRDPIATLVEFYQLASPHQSNDKALKKQAEQIYETWGSDNLILGLEYLLNTDFRAVDFDGYERTQSKRFPFGPKSVVSYDSVRCLHISFISGDSDAVVPWQAGNWFANKLSQTSCNSIFTLLPKVAHDVTHNLSDLKKYMSVKWWHNSLNTSESVLLPFSKKAFSYDEHSNIQSRVAEKTLLLILEATDSEMVLPSRILDVGCGSGFLSLKLSKHFQNAAVLGLDIAANMITVAREKSTGISNLHYVVGSIYDDNMSSLNSSAFNLIVSSSAIHWMYPFEKLFSRLSRLCLPGTPIIFSFMADGTLGELHSLRRKMFPETSPKYQLPSLDTITNAMIKTGYAIMHSKEESELDMHENATLFFRSLSKTGVTGASYSRGDRYLSIKEIRSLISAYETEYKDTNGVAATYHIGYVVARSCK